MGEGEGEETTRGSGGLSASSRSAHSDPCPSLSSMGSAGVGKALRHDTTLAGAVKSSQAHQQRNEIPASHHSRRARILRQLTWPWEHQLLLLNHQTRGRNSG